MLLLIEPVVVQPRYPVNYPPRAAQNKQINPLSYNAPPTTYTKDESDTIKDKFNKVQNYINLSNSIIKTDSSQAKFLLVKAETLVDEISKEPLNEIRSNLLITYKDLINKLKNELPKTPPSKHEIKMNNPIFHNSPHPSSFPSPSSSPFQPPPPPQQQPHNLSQFKEGINMMEYNKMLFEKANNHIEMGDNYLINYPLEAKREYESGLELLKSIERNINNNIDIEFQSKVNIKKNVLNDKMSVLMKMLEGNQSNNNHNNNYSQNYHNSLPFNINPPKPANNNVYQRNNNGIIETI